jgi:hypothetical protein
MVIGVLVLRPSHRGGAAAPVRAAKLLVSVVFCCCVFKLIQFKFIQIYESCYSWLLVVVGGLNLNFVDVCSVR